MIDVQPFFERCAEIENLRRLPVAAEGKCVADNQATFFHFAFEFFADLLCQITAEIHDDGICCAASIIIEILA